MWEREVLNLLDLASRDRREIEAIDRRLSLPLGGKGKGRKKGYGTKEEAYQKKRRRQRLAARLTRTEKRIEEGRVSITVGTKRLARKRHNLEAAGLTVEEWRSQWDAKRMFLSADGEGGKPWGNETIRVTPHANGYHVTIRLPSPLSHLSNTPGQTPTYRLSAPIEWHHLHEEWHAQASSDRPVGYRMSLDPDKNRWYITASWSLAPSEEPPTVEEASASGRCLGIDLNSGHMDGRILDTHGNPVGRPIRKDIPEKGPSTHRLGALREAVSQLVKWARSQGVTVIAVEKLDFSDIRALGRQRPRRGKAGRTNEEEYVWHTHLQVLTHHVLSYPPQPP